LKDLNSGKPIPEHSRRLKRWKRRSLVIFSN